ncbi:AN1-type zinc finger protein 2A-like [Arctopsyche grandis]|uniref:AN1-type zinc finger protein 2A-like n=1 Tax=Arctopsyche grandis TaxID=121162 RepID=UPI00406D7327
MEFPHLGDNCSHSSCNQLDFLPMKCDSCLKNYCANHFRYEHHQCDGARKRDLQVPTCPLCSAPVPGKRGEAPDIAVSEHIDNDCQADPAKQRRNKIFTNRCTLKGCKNKEMVPLICAECSSNFCFRHRHSADHQCIGKVAAIKMRSEEAALSRMKAKQTTPLKRIQNTAISNTGLSPQIMFNEVQGTMSEDEALAHALALSLQTESQDSRNNSPSRRNPTVNQTQRVGGESSGRCIVS